MYFPNNVRMLVDWRQNAALLYVAALLCLTVGCGAAAHNKSDAVAAAQPVDDDALRLKLHKAAVALVHARKHVATATLVRQLSRHQLTLPALTKPAGSLRDAVVVLGTLYRCDKCSDWHLGISTGFLISAAGACVTSYHVVDRPETETLVAMTATGTIHAVREVLAADKLHDVAIVRLEGQGFHALDLGHDPSPGARVRVLSHPDSHFFSLTEGVVSRSYVRQGMGGPATMIEVTAAFAKGSSGAPVVNEAGAVIGVASNTHSIYYHDDKKPHGVRENLQMVLRRASPVSALRRLLSR